MPYKTGITREIGGYDTEHKSTMGGKTTSPEDMRYEGVDKEEGRGEIWIAAIFGISTGGGRGVGGL